MNNDRRKALQELSYMLCDLQGKLASLRDEEQDCFYNMPAYFKLGKKGEKEQEAIECLSSACDDLSNVIDSINNAI